tara:strand:- start:13624 stop:14121 length:498 start_codon:yes stop_codon:yes gene_type:complete
MKDFLKPDWDCEMPIYEINLQEIEKVGIKSLILDLDGTLISRNSINPSHLVKDWIKNAKKKFSIHILTNNPYKKRVEIIANNLEIPFTFRGLKPRRKTALKIIKNFNINNRAIAIVGDRIFTDVLLGKRLGLFTILVKSLDDNGNARKNNYIQFTEKFLASLITT